MRFACGYNGASMEPDYLDGDVIVADPDRSPELGCLVVARLGRTKEMIFREYRPRGTDDAGTEIIDLVPLNDDFPIITLDSKNPGGIVGTVIEHQHKPRDLPKPRAEGEAGQ